MASNFKKIIDILNQPIGGKNTNTKKDIAARQKNLKIKPLELTYRDTVKHSQNIRYTYKARTLEGDIIEGQLEALSKVDVYSFLQSQGYDVLSIKEDELFNSLGLNSLTTRQMKDKDLSFFLTQLSTCLKAGITLIESVEILAKQTQNKNTKSLYKHIVFELNSGKTFSEALEKQGLIFPRLLINMIKTSELTGNLIGVLDEMASYYKNSDENRKQIISAMTYPAVIFIIATIVLFYVMLYVVPSFTDMYNKLGSELPPITLTIMNISDFLANNLISVILTIIISLSILVISYQKVPKFKYSIQYVTMHIPVIKNIIIYKEIIMFTKTFASLLNYDVFITDSMEILGKITDNEIYKKLINNTITNLSAGNNVSLAFKDNWAFPSIAYEMLQTGEKTGHLGSMMTKVADYYNNEQKNLITSLKSLIEPVMIVLLALVVGIILLAVIIPMFNMYDGII